MSVLFHLPASVHYSAERHVWARPDEDGFVTVGVAAPLREVLWHAPDVDEIYEKGVVLKLDAASAEERLHRPEGNPATMSASPDDVTEGELERKLRRAWDLISGNY